MGLDHRYTPLFQIHISLFLSPYIQAIILICMSMSSPFISACYLTLYYWRNYIFAKLQTFWACQTFWVCHTYWSSNKFTFWAWYTFWARHTFWAWYIFWALHTYLLNSAECNTAATWTAMNPYIRPSWGWVRSCVDISMKYRGLKYAPSPKNTLIAHTGIKERTVSKVSATSGLTSSVAPLVSMDFSACSWDFLSAFSAFFMP